MGFVCGIERLQKYTIELKIRNNESSKVIQNGVEQVMEAKKFVERDLKEYSNQFNSLYTLRIDYTYRDTN